MACFHPIDAWRPLNFTGKRSIYFGEPPEFVPVKGHMFGLPARVERFKVPCGKCIGCLIDRSKQWALRCVLEAKSHEDNSFITLTYDNEHLPADGSLDFDDLQRFFKRLRKKIGNERIRYYAVGEYGAKLSRPHFHAIIFGYGFGDRRLWSCSRGQNLYRSELLESVWNYGYSTVGSVSFESCAYVARYVQKKLYGADREDVLAYYGGRLPEAARMSRRPGIASQFFHEYESDIYPKDYITVKGVKYKPGRYFDMLYKKEHPEEMLQLRVKRLEKVLEKIDDCSEDRLAAREECQKRRVSRLVRGFEEGDQEIK